MASQIRMDITEALEREKARIEGVKGAWRGDAAARLETINAMLDNLKGDRVCFMEVRQELKPWEIKL